MNTAIVLPLTVSFVIILLAVPYWTRKARKYGFVERDVHKKEGAAVGLGGLLVVFGFVAGILAYVAAEIFYFKNLPRLDIIFAVLASMLIALIIGMVDDLLGWKIGLKKHQKILLVLLIALPIMAINAGASEITLPFIGKINIFFLYPLIVVPLGISGAANGFNIIGGYNGLEAGMGIIILAAQGFITLSTGETAASVIAFTMVAALLAFLIYNKYPAKIFPGDSMTYSVGALIGIIAVIGNVEKFSVMLFTPYLLEGILKLRGRLKKESFAKLLPDGSLAEPYKKYYGLEHIAITIARKIKKKCHETDVVLMLWAFQMAVAAIVLLYFYLPRI